MRQIVILKCYKTGLKAIKNGEHNLDWVESSCFQKNCEVILGQNQTMQLGCEITIPEEQIRIGTEGGLVQTN